MFIGLLPDSGKHHILLTNAPMIQFASRINSVEPRFAEPSVYFLSRKIRDGDGGRFV